jgi:acetamidase/formamidase
LTTHHFVPEHFHTTIGWHEPVLRISPGDRVVTTTVNAGARDLNETQVTPGPNPQTGPFYIEGADAGDTLVINIERITPNRPRGFAATVVAANVVDPEFVRELPPRRNVHWSIDLEHGVVLPTAATGPLADVRLPLAPMLGCFGVAPAGGQAISTATSAEHGGNMDYRAFAAGTTVYLPVFAPGALFHLGDAHATQGDGEITGTGVEIFAEVEFSVDLRKGRKIGWPRGETSDHIFTVGNARPLDQALQHATTEMIRWLSEDYGFDTASACSLIGQCVEYDVGNVYNPAYTMVCKVPKRVLAAHQ